MIIEFFFLFGTLLLLSAIFHRKPKNFPPGEWGLPVVGYLPFMSRKNSKTLKILQKKYGKIFSVKLGSKVLVVLSDFGLIKSAFQRSEFSGRPFSYHFKIAKKHTHIGINLTAGQIWMTNRKFMVKTLHYFGLGKPIFLDDIILNEAKSLIQDLKGKLNKPIEIDWSINVAILNVIWKLVANCRYEVSDKEVKKFAKNIQDNFKDRDEAMAIISLFPWLIPFVPRFIMNKWMHEDRIVKKRDEVIQLLLDVVNDHKKKLDKDDPKDFIDKYLIEMEEQKNNPDYQHCGDEDLLQILFDTFIAGSETTSSTIRWFFLYMGRFPDIQKRIQRDIDDNIPKGQYISIDDKDKLPTLEALTFEINRNVSLLPNALPHEVTQDTVLEGYDIPKGTVVIPDIMACHRNPKFWKFPNDFCVENFLDENGKIQVNKEGYLPFSIGKRMCLGESMAKMELFIFMGTILQNFEISEPDGQNVSLEESDANTSDINFAPNFKVILKNRN